MKTAVVGCGYVAEQYGATLGDHPELQLVGAFDSNAKNLQAFVDRWPARRYDTFEQLLSDREVELVLNLTNPRSHFEINKRCLEAGKHVYRKNRWR